MKRLVLVLFVVISLSGMLGCVDNSEARIAAENQVAMLESMKEGIDQYFAAMLLDLEAMQVNQVDIIYDDTVSIEADPSGNIPVARVKELMDMYRAERTKAANDISLIRKNLDEWNTTYSQVYQIAQLLASYLDDKNVRFKDIKDIITRVKNIYGGK